MNKDVIIALDFENDMLLNEFLNEFLNEDVYVKVGMELFYQFGINIVKKLQDKGFKIFLDLKLHDIPNTVIKTMKYLKTLNVDIINLHASVGSYTMRQVSELFADSDTKVIGVTLLTSTDKHMLENELAIELSAQNYVLHLAQLCKDSGLDGIVCSPNEVVDVKRLIGDDFLCVTPGIRYSLNEDDQKRVTTPSLAREYGSDYIVVGRVITQSENKVDTYNKVKKEFLGV